MKGRVKLSDFYGTVTGKIIENGKYEGPTLYFQNCPMAFNDTEPANWISKTKEIMNPYMGKKHPKYQSGMLNCGEIIDTIKAK